MDAEHDIFVSYAHGNTGANVEAPALREWTRVLIEKLKEDLALAGRKVDVWYDEALEGNDPLTPTIKEHLERSALFVVVMSPPYLASVWCRRELGWFEHQVKRRGGVAGDVFVVDAWPTDRGRWPAFLQDPDGETLIGYSFHEGRGNKVGPHGWRLPQDDDKAYYDALSKLAGSILKRLGARKPAKPAGPTPPVTTGHRNVYLAWGTDDVAKRRGELRELLRARGFTVLPDPEPAAPTEFLARLEADLRGCKAFLQLLGGHGGQWDGDPVGPVAYQRARAGEAGIPILAWRNHRLPLEAIEDEAYRALLDEWSPADFAGSDQLADQVGGLVPLPTSSAPPDDAPPAAYLAARAEAEPLRLELLDALLGPDLLVMPVFSDASVDLKDIDKAAQARLDSYALCKALLLLRADGSPWIDQEILKFLTKDRIRLRKERNHELACAIVDRLGGSTALARRMGIEVFPWTDAASVEPIRSWLKGTVAALAEAAE